MQPPEIRYNRFEQTVAVRWADADYWYVFEPERFIYGADGERFSAHPDATFPHGEDGWINPLVDYRPDVHVWTDAIRREMSSIQRILDGAERHPWSG